ncbi:hypothetical protein BKA67DRAFT_591730 [Truncatella angustata]|uniref:phosphoserine transaminase n=1 Tax=Truncatella angustata TaxID=152316 RepID=A0A9P8UNE8_9PEZI|nr:uncharacterized protein BKA67DRAFT_591730 [Truncatella angustata]KAH6655302.1 hypothetical protein BKA67DRAFT_591730 [Truncatella angustata]
MPTRVDITYIGSASSTLLDFEGMGLGIAEHSHHSALAAKIINEFNTDLATTLIFLMTMRSSPCKAVTRKQEEAMKQINDDKTKVPELLQKQVDMELKLDYIVTGGWSLKAYQKACRLLGEGYVNLATDTRTITDEKFGKIPEEKFLEAFKGRSYEIFTPKADSSSLTVVLDMSSNILSRRILIKNYHLIFFGAQKESWIHWYHNCNCQEESATSINNCSFNTLSIFYIYIAGQVLKKALADYRQFEVDGQEAVSNDKATLSRTSCPLSYEHLLQGQQRRRRQELGGLNGHCSVGGSRASNYNLIPLKGAQKLSKYIEDFARA